MKKLKAVLILAITFISIAIVVYFAGQLALSNSPAYALIPAGFLLASILVYAKLSGSDTKN